MQVQPDFIGILFIQMCYCEYKSNYTNISGNDITANGSSSRGINLYYTAYNTINSNNLKLTDISTDSKCGIYFDGANNNTALNNTIYNNVRGGIWIGNINSFTVPVSDNYFEKNYISEATIQFNDTGADLYDMPDIGFDVGTGNNNTFKDTRTGKNYIIIWYDVNSVNAKFTWSDNRILVKENRNIGYINNSKIIYYPTNVTTEVRDQSNISKVSFTTRIYFLNNTITPSSDYIMVNFPTWNNIEDYNKTFYISSSNASVTAYITIGDLQTNINYQVNKNNSYWNSYISNISGYINFRYADGDLNNTILLEIQR